MKALRKLPDEDWRGVIERLATDPRFNTIGIDAEMAVEEFDYRTSEQGEDPRDAAWDIADSYGLLDTLEGFWSDDEDELDEVAA
jgi:predicted kinase